MIIAGQAYNPELGDRIKVTVVATGFEPKTDVMGGEADTESAVRRFVNNEQPKEQQYHIDQRAQSQRLLSLQRAQSLMLNQLLLIAGRIYSSSLESVVYSQMITAFQQ